MIEYEDQNPRIQKLWLGEIKQNNITPLLKLPVS